MTKPDFHILLAKWLEGKLTKEEEKLLASTTDLEELKASLDRIDSYSFPHLDKDALFEKIQKKKVSKSLKAKRLVPLWLRLVAAVFVFGLFGLWWWNTLPTTIVSGLAEHKTIHLPDQTEVVLNAGTELKYYDRDWKNQRLVKLKGEAFFKVTKGKPFIVESAMGKVEVLGTQFKVKDRADLYQVVCYEGTVRVGSTRANAKTILHRGEGTRWDGKSLADFKDMHLSPEWMNGVSSFTKIPLEEVFHEIERQYNYKVSISGVNLHRSFTGEFPHDDLRGALDRVCGAMNLKYEILQNGKEVKIAPVE